MTQQDFTHLFPEWALAWSLRQTCTKDASRFWQEARFHPTASPGDGTSLAAKFPDVKAVPALVNERPFPKDGAKRYGIDEERYRSTFWGLRPDFVIELEDSGLLLLLEAKGGLVPDNTWTNPKELLYFRFLNESTIPQHKGFFYIVPVKYAEPCRKCLDEYFAPTPTVQTGLFVWEELLPITSEKLMETALDQVIKEMEGLKCVREWQRGAG